MSSPPLHSVQEEPLLRVIHNPPQALLQVLPGYRATPQHIPPMRSYVFELQSLRLRSTLSFADSDFHLPEGSPGCPCSRQHRSCWQRPEEQTRKASVFDVSNTQRTPDSTLTSSSSNPCSSFRQSSILSLSVASTTHIRASVFSK